MSDYLLRLSRQTVPIFIKHDVKRVSVFGSVLRDDFKPGKSDIDFLVELPKEKTLFDQLKLKVELEEKLGEEVDLVEYDTLHKRIKNQVINSAVNIL